jgi:hypothetical protein
VRVREAISFADEDRDRGGRHTRHSAAHRARFLRARSLILCSALLYADQINFPSASNASSVGVRRVNCVVGGQVALVALRFRFVRRLSASLAHSVLSPPPPLTARAVILHHTRSRLSTSAVPPRIQSTSLQVVACEETVKMH